jgi:hypothetical protein
MKPGPSTKERNHTKGLSEQDAEAITKKKREQKGEGNVHLGSA